MHNNNYALEPIDALLTAWTWLGSTWHYVQILCLDNYYGTCTGMHVPTMLKSNWSKLRWGWNKPMLCTAYTTLKSNWFSMYLHDCSTWKHRKRLMWSILKRWCYNDVSDHHCFFHCGSLLDLPLVRAPAARYGFWRVYIMMSDWVREREAGRCREIQFWCI